MDFPCLFYGRRFKCLHNLYSVASYSQKCKFKILNLLHRCKMQIESIWSQFKRDNGTRCDINFSVYLMSTVDSNIFWSINYTFTYVLWSPQSSIASCMVTSCIICYWFRLCLASCWPAKFIIYIFLLRLCRHIITYRKKLMIIQIWLLFTIQFLEALLNVSC